MRKSAAIFLCMTTIVMVVILSCTPPGTAGLTPTPTPTPTPPDVEIQGDIIFTVAGGWFETAYAEWQVLSGATGYTAYCKPASSDDSAYVQVDSALIRIPDSNYPGTFRVDIPGLLGNTAYNVRVAPLSGATEYLDQASVVQMTTRKFDRSGFAFSPDSPMGPTGGTTGGYLSDGTINPAAKILYVTDGNKNDVELAVTKNGTTTVWTGIANIMYARQSAKDATPLVIRFIGVVTAPSGTAFSSDTALLDVKDNYNVTIEGIGNDSEVSGPQLYGWGLNIVRARNIEVRNLSFYMFPEDSVSLQDTNRNVWIHNNDFMIGADGGGDKVLGDGSCDIKADSSYITVSYNHFIGTGKSSLCGLSESTDFYITYHHNWFDVSGSRHPRVCTGTIHVYNNYYKGNYTYGVGAAEASSIFVQNNYFENCVRPMIIASQGHDYKDLLPGTGDHESMLSGEDGGTIKASGNYMDTFSAAWFDPVKDTGNASVGGTIYNKFDESFSANGYPYALQSAADAMADVVTYSGRLKNSTEPIVIPAQTDAQKVAAAKALLQTALAGVYYTDKATTEAAAAAAIAGQQASFEENVLATYATNETAQTTTITIVCGSASDTVVIRAQTADEKIAAARTLIAAAIAGITYTDAATTLAAAQAAITGVAGGFAAGVSAEAVIDSGNNDNIVITVSCSGGTSQTLTITAPTSAERVAAAKAVLLANSAIHWSTDAATTYVEVSAALVIANADGSLHGATATAVQGTDFVTITITHTTASDTIVLSASRDWTSLDIGTAAGTTAISGGIYTISGAGKFESAAQNFRYVYTLINGDFTMTAHLESFTNVYNSSNQAWAGLMLAPSLEGTLTGNAFLYAASVMRGDVSYCYGHRLVSGTNAKAALGVPAGSQTAGVYLKLRRSGSTYYASYSWDGSVWGSESSFTFTSALPATVNVGFCVSGSQNIATVVFSSVVITQ